MPRLGTVPALSILWLTHEPPLPAVTGSRVRSGRLIGELQRRGHRVSLFSLATGAPAGPQDQRELDGLVECCVVAPLDIGRVRRSARLAADVALRRPFQERWFVSRGGQERVRAWLARDQFDVVVAGGLYMLAYVPRELRPRTVLDTHNVDAHRLAGMADALWPHPRGVAARLQVAPVRRFERSEAARVGAVLAVSSRDAGYFEQVAPGRVTVVPNGVDVAGVAARIAPAAGTEVLFVGTMTYSANVDAALELLREIAPRLRRRDARITLVGGGVPKVVRAAAAAADVPVDVAGRVPDIGPWFDRSRLLAAPMRFGGGTRLKILEALARGVPVVTTSAGAQGLDLVHGRDAIVVDDTARFAHWIDRLLDEDELCARLAAAGRLVAERYDWRRVGDAFEPVLARVAAGGGRAQSPAA